MHNNIIHCSSALYFLLVSAVTACVTAADKIKAKKGRRRISEKTLFILALSGGSISEYITMKIIRHKTLHKRFMIGLPVIILLQLSAVIIFILWQKGILPGIIQ